MSGAGPAFPSVDLRALLAKQPVIVALAGSNGAGKSTFFETFLAGTGLPFINADIISLRTGCDPYEAAALAEDLRNDWARERRSFVFETVFSDPVGDKVNFLAAAKAGHNVILIFIGIASPEVSDQRVSMRVKQGGHDVPREKISQRYPRTIANLKLAIQRLPLVVVYDNSRLSEPYTRIALFENGTAKFMVDPPPDWFPNLEE